jgi:hypothetical protein
VNTAQPMRVYERISPRMYRVRMRTIRALPLV